MICPRIAGSCHDLPTIVDLQCDLERHERLQRIIAADEILQIDSHTVGPHRSDRPRNLCGGIYKDGGPDDISLVVDIGRPADPGAGERRQLTHHAALPDKCTNVRYYAELIDGELDRANHLPAVVEIGAGG